MATFSQHEKTSGFVDNWQGGKTLAECNLYMLNKEDSCDVTFRCGSIGYVIKAHRYMLISRSCVFHAMFTGPLAETSEVNVPDIKHNYFRLFLRYIYTDSITIDSDNVTALLYTARKYAITGLEIKCLKFLEENMNIDNVCTILEAAFCFDHHELIEKAMTFIKRKREKLLGSPHFTSLRKELVNQIVESDDLVADEHVIFTAVNNWAETECGSQGREVTPEAKRSVLGDTLKRIRYPLMENCFLENEVKKSQLLEADEVEKLIASACVDGKPFSTKKRRQVKSVPKEDIKIKNHFSVSKSRFQKKGYKWLFNPIREYATDFQSHKDLLLHGFRLFGPCSYSKDTKATFDVAAFFADYGDSTGSRILEKTKYTVEGNVYDVLLYGPVRIHAMEWYTLRVVIDGPPSWRGERELKVVVCDDGLRLDFRKSFNAKMSTDSNQAQIPSLIYSLL